MTRRQGIESKQQAGLILLMDLLQESRDCFNFGNRGEGIGDFRMKIPYLGNFVMFTLLFQTEKCAFFSGNSTWWMLHGMICPFGNSRCGICPFQLNHPHPDNNFTPLERLAIFSLYLVSSDCSILPGCSPAVPPNLFPSLWITYKKSREVKPDREYCAKISSNRTVAHANPAENEWANPLKHPKYSTSSSPNRSHWDDQSHSQIPGTIPYLRDSSLILLLCFCFQLLLTFPFQFLLNFLALVHFDSSKGQAKDQCFSCQNVHQQWEVLQSLECQKCHFWNTWTIKKWIYRDVVQLPFQ